MEKFTIRFGSNEPLKNYLDTLFVERGYEVDWIIESDTQNKFDIKQRKFIANVECPQSMFFDLISDAIVLVYKFMSIEKVFENIKPCILLSAYYGVLLTQEFEKEKQYVEKKIGIGNLINLDGVFTFLLAELEYSWRALSTLAHKLYVQCKNDDDIYALIKYFLSGEILLKGKIVVDGGLFFDSGYKPVPCVNFFENNELNIVLNLLFRKPSEVMVTSPQIYSDELISFITKLG